MTKTALILTSAVSILALLLSGSQPELSQSLTETEVVGPSAPAECTWQLELECAIVIESTVLACSKAFETQGSDIIADIKCAKDLMADKKACWPCICAEAKKKGWHVVGC